MHVDAFYEYLLDNPHPYWTEIPTTPSPVTEGGRDGVAAEDDMALRSLLPHIRPRRGRKRPDESRTSGSPSTQRLKIGEIASGDGATIEHQPLDFWTPSPDPRGSDLFFATQNQISRATMDIPQGTTGAIPWLQPDVFSHTPISTPSYTTITPVAAVDTLWSDQNRESIQAAVDSSSEATIPAGSKQNRRHGAKVVSSAWRSGGPGQSGKTRGRPPMKRHHTNQHSQSGEGQSREELSPFPAFQSRGQTSSPQSTLGHNTPLISSSAMPMAIMTLGSTLPTATITASPEPGYSNMASFDTQTQEQPENDRQGRKLTGRLFAQLEVPTKLGTEIGTAGSYSHNERGPISILLNDGPPPAPEQPSIFMPHSPAGPETHIIDPFASSAQNTYFPPGLHLQQLEHDPGQLQTTPQEPTLCSTEGSQLQGVAYSHTQQHELIQKSQPPTSAITDKSIVPNSSIRGYGLSYQSGTDRTNLDNVEALLAYALLSASWHDATGQSTPACDVGEAVSIASTLIETVRRGTNSPEAFVSNISTLTGTTFLRNSEGHTVRVYRVDEGPEMEHSDQPGSSRILENVYDIHWDLRLGDVRGGFHLRERVKCVDSKDSRTESMSSARRYARDRTSEADKDAEGDVEEAYGQGLGKGATDSGKHGRDEPDWWRRKYQALLGVVHEQNVELSQLRRAMLNRD